MAGVPAARQALAILTHLASRPGPVGASAIARELGLPRSTTYHLLAELAAADFVVHLPGGPRLRPGRRCLRGGLRVPAARPARAAGATRCSPASSSRPGLTAQLGILQGAETVYLLKEQPPGAATLVTDVGVRLPAHLTASGRAMLAHLPAAHVRAQLPSASSFTTRTGRGPASLTRPARRARGRAAARLGVRGRRGHRGAGVGGRGGVRPRRPAGRRGRAHVPRAHRRARPRPARAGRGRGGRRRVLAHQRAPAER